MYDVSILMIYNVDASRDSMRGEVCAIDRPASKFATWDGLEYVSNKKINSPRGVKLHVINIPDTLDISKVLHPEYKEVEGKLRSIRRRSITVIPTRIDQNLISEIVKNKKEGTIDWSRFRTFLRNQAEDRDFIDSDIEIKDSDFRSDPLSSAIKQATKNG